MKRRHSHYNKNKTTTTTTTLSIIELRRSLQLAVTLYRITQKMSVESITARNVIYKYLLFGWLPVRDTACYFD